MSQIIPGLPPTNNPDLRIAQEWFAQLDAHIRNAGLSGYDPFDVKQHPLIRAAQPHFLPRKLTTALTDLFPKASRKVLSTAQTENPKAHALVALACLRMHQYAQDASFLDRAESHLAWLEEHTAQGHPGTSWGYPFDVRAKGLDTPSGTPISVVSAIAGEAFGLAHEIAPDARRLETIRGIAQFILEALPRMEEEDGTYCFGYTPQDRRRVHNASLLSAEHLVRAGTLLADPELIGAAEPALQFSLQRQREDGAWHYGEHSPEEPFEAGMLRLVDHHHTGFVLRSLHAIHALTPREDVREALRKGFAYYRKLFTPLGMPINAYGKYPVDIHACAEATLCSAVLSSMFPPARRYAVAAIRWSWYYMRDPKTGAPHYRKYPFHTARIAFPRWGTTWMFRAVAEYLYRLRPVD